VFAVDCQNAECDGELQFNDPTPDLLKGEGLVFYPLPRRGHPGVVSCPRCRRQVEGSFLLLGDVDGRLVAGQHNLAFID